jgi:predicted amidophosphoribosyltransferase
MFEVARALKRNIGTPDFPLLVRRSGGAQKGLQYQARLENICGTVKLSRRAGRLPSRVVLIDDIFTTGATVDECARVLLRGGVKKVFVLTLAVDL